MLVLIHYVSLIQRIWLHKIWRSLWQGTTFRQVSGPMPSSPSASSVRVSHALGHSSNKSEAFSRPTRKARRQHWRSRRIVQNSRRIHTGPWMEKKSARTMVPKLRWFRLTPGPKVKPGSRLRAAMCRKMGWIPQLLLHTLLAWREMSMSRRRNLDKFYDFLWWCSQQKDLPPIALSYSTSLYFISMQPKRPLPWRPRNSRWTFLS